MVQPIEPVEPPAFAFSPNPDDDPNDELNVANVYHDVESLSERRLKPPEDGSPSRAIYINSLDESQKKDLEKLVDMAHTKMDQQLQDPDLKGVDFSHFDNARRLCALTATRNDTSVSRVYFRPQVFNEEERQNVRDTLNRIFPGAPISHLQTMQLYIDHKNGSLYTQDFNCDRPVVIESTEKTEPGVKGFTKPKDKAQATNHKQAANDPAPKQAKENGPSRGNRQEALSEEEKALQEEAEKGQRNMRKPMYGGGGQGGTVFNPFAGLGGAIGKTFTSTGKGIATASPIVAAGAARSGKWLQNNDRSIRMIRELRSMDHSARGYRAAMARAHAIKSKAVDGDFSKYEKNPKLLKMVESSEVYQSAIQSAEKNYNKVEQKLNSSKKALNKSYHEAFERNGTPLSPTHKAEMEARLRSIEENTKKGTATAKKLPTIGEDGKLTNEAKKRKLERIQKKLKEAALAAINALKRLVGLRPSAGPSATSSMAPPSP